MADKIKKFVKIQSSATVRVTSGLQYQDFTKQNSDVPNRMKVAPEWQNAMCLIKMGQHVYPSEIIEWPTVKLLQKDGVLTIGEFVDDAEDEVVKNKTELNDAVESIKSKTKSLSDIAGE